MSAPIGILMLDTRFPRPPGDIGNPATWPFPVIYRTVPLATPTAAVTADPTPLLTAFIAEGRALVDAGCAAISTSCGFLAPFQEDLTQALGVPVATSALLQAPMIARTLPPGRKIGVLTISAKDLTASHFRAAGLAPDTPVEGTGADSHFTRQILDNAPTLDLARAEADNLAAARRLVTNHPEVAAILLECTNMPPYAAAIHRETGRPVYSIVTCLDWLRAALAPT